MPVTAPADPTDPTHPTHPTDPTDPADGERRRNAERTRTEILDVATDEFGRQGFAGTRVDEIAARTSTTKRMIYYYFGSKERLYVAVLERAFEAVRLKLDPAGAGVSGDDPLAVARWIAERTYEQHRAHPDLLRLLVIENLHEARNIAGSRRLRELGRPDPGLLEQVLADGERLGVVRADVDALDVHLVMTAFCAFLVTNRFTQLQFTGRDLLDPAADEHQRRMLGDLVVGYLTAPAG
jgi:AcrR family transcriptional regulator